MSCAAKCPENREHSLTRVATRCPSEEAYPTRKEIVVNDRATKNFGSRPLCALRASASQFVSVPFDEGTSF
jgi:hypothetical protein